MSETGNYRHLRRLTFPLLLLAVLALFALGELLTAWTCQGEYEFGYGCRIYDEAAP